jgi:hypothetical protein
MKLRFVSHGALLQLVLKLSEKELTITLFP